MILPFYKAQPWGITQRLTYRSLLGFFCLQFFFPFFITASYPSSFSSSSLSLYPSSSFFSFIVTNFVNSDSLFLTCCSFLSFSFSFNSFSSNDLSYLFLCRLKSQIFLLVSSCCFFSQLSQALVVCHYFYVIQFWSIGEVVWKLLDLVYLPGQYQPFC